MQRGEFVVELQLLQVNLRRRTPRPQQIEARVLPGVHAFLHNRHQPLGGAAFVSHRCMALLRVVQVHVGHDHILGDLVAGLQKG